MNHIELKDIVDVEMISCEKHDTESGFFREILRLQDFGRIQISQSRVLGGVFKGFHGHKTQVQATIFLSGKVSIEFIPIVKIRQGDCYSIHASKKNAHLKSALIKTLRDMLWGYIGFMVIQFYLIILMLYMSIVNFMILRRK